MYYPFESEATTVAHFAAGLLPQLGDLAAQVGWHRSVLARAAAVKLYKQGWRTSKVGEYVIATTVDRPIPCSDDDPGPGSRADVAA